MNRGHCDYILSNDRQFKAVNIINTRTFFEDHSAVVATYYVKDKRTHKRYKRRRKKFPLRVNRGQGNEGDRLLNKLKQTKASLRPSP
jgi:ribosomal protein S17